MFKISSLNKISFFLVLFSAINWGFIGLLKINLVNFLAFGSIFLQRLIYIMFLASAINLIILIYKCLPFNSYR